MLSKICKGEAMKKIRKEDRMKSRIDNGGRSTGDTELHS